MKLIRELHETIKEDSKLIIFCDNKILYDQDKNTYSFAIKDLNLSDQLGPYLAIALIDNCFVYVLNIDEDQNILGLFMDPDVIHFVELRQMLGILDQSSFLLLSRATILKSWLSANVFCSICGNQNSFNKKEGAFECSCSAAPKYPTISPCIITLIYDEDNILLGRSKFFPPNMYSTLAGFIEAGENAEEALIREVKEEVNVEITNIKYFSSQSWPFPAQLMLGYFCQYKKGEIILNDAELEDARWFDIKELPIIPPDASISGQLIRSYIEGRLKL
ncbi:NAD(+) diphosphatase [Gammaproteobacteria bacterium]|jgi:NAD+ diphosphatase|nr:NAD(+) diphosphatase [Gammaproteobacteria bacterium]MDC1147862.1 NAD(+) diphosphatase [Gammaproteobacteria bacterium]